MRVYKVTMVNEDETGSFMWFPSEVKAKAHLKHWQKGHDKHPLERVELVELPKKNAEMIAWLNENLSRG